MTITLHQHDLPDGKTFRSGDACERDTIDNDPGSYYPLPEDAPEAARVAISYEVEFVESSTDWTDRWDVYLIGSPDDDRVFASQVA